MNLSKMFGPKIGTWWTESKKDSRFNLSGRGKFLISDGSAALMAERAVKKKEAELKVKAPDDIMFSCMKD